MTSLDYGVMAAYVVGLLLMSGVVGCKIKDSKDLFAAGDQSPWWASGLSGFMTMFSAGTFVVWGGIAYKHGFVAVSISLCYGVAALLVGFFVAGHWRRIGVTTAAEFIRLRFGETAMHFYTWFGVVYKMIGVGVALYSLAVLFCALIPLPADHILADPQTGHFSLVWAVVLAGGIVTLYTVVGGLWAVLMTDVLQFLVLSIAVLITVPLLLGHERIGGIDGFIQRAPEGFLSPTHGEFTWFFLVGWAAIHVFMIGGEWAFVQRFLCVPSERDAKKSAWLFGVLYLVSPVLWMLPPMAYRLINPDAAPEEAYILSCRTVLPPGMVGLVLAAMFSATASMVDSQLNVFSGVLTRDFYGVLLRKDMDEERLVRVGRVIMTVLGLALIGIALVVPRLGGAEKIVLSVATLLATPILAPTVWALLSPRLDGKSVWITAGVCFSVGALAKFGFSEGVLLDRIEWLGPFGEWVRNHGRVMEVLCGVVLPVTILAMLHVTGRPSTPGWARVQVRAAAWRESKHAPPSHLPTMLLAWGLSGLAVLLAVVAALQERTIGVLWIAVVGLVVAASVTLWQAFKLRKQSTS